MLLAACDDAARPGETATPLPAAPQATSAEAAPTLLTQRGLYRIGATGGQAGLLVKGLEAPGSKSAWSPDGRLLALIAFTGPDPEQRAWELVVVDPVGRTPERRYPLASGSWRTGPVWSADGTRVSAMVHGTVTTLFIVDPARDTVRPVWTIQGECYVGWSGCPSLALSPDGRHAAAPTKKSREEPARLVVVDTTSGKERVFLEGNARDLAWSPHEDLLAYSAEVRDGAQSDTAIFLVAGDGRSPSRRLTSGRPLRWSPDGQRLLIERHEDGRGVLYAVDLDGAEQRLAEGEGGVWAPSGDRVAFLREGDLYVAGLQGGEVQRLTWLMFPFATHVAWRADGQELLFDLSPPLETDDLYVVDLKSGEERYIGLGSRPRWSADSSRLVFWAGSGGFVVEGHHYVVRPDGSDLRQVGASTLSDVIGPCQTIETGYILSHDGAWLAYDTTGNRQQPQGVYVASTEDGAPRRIAEGFSPSWTPDGRIAFAARVRETSRCQIVVTNREGGDRRVLYEGLSPRWSPDGTRLAFVDDEGLKIGDPEGKTARLIQPGAGPRGRLAIGPRSLSWSPSGRFLAYQFQGYIYTAEAAGGATHRLTDGELLGWTPEDRIAQYQLRGDRRLSLVDPLEEQPERPIDIGQFQSAAWSPDGRYMAVARRP